MTDLEPKGGFKESVEGVWVSEVGTSDDEELGTLGCRAAWRESITDFFQGFLNRDSVSVPPAGSDSDSGSTTLTEGW